MDDLSDNKKYVGERLKEAFRMSRIESNGNNLPVFPYLRPLYHFGARDFKMLNEVSTSLPLVYVTVTMHCRDVMCSFIIQDGGQSFLLRNITRIEDMKNLYNIFTNYLEVFRMEWTYKVLLQISFQPTFTESRIHHSFLKSQYKFFIQCAVWRTTRHLVSYVVKY